MLNLDSSLLVGKGLHRECYVHPDEKNLCIKIIVAEGGYKEVKREQAYYQRLRNRDISWTILPKFYGNIETNLGTGAVFDLIRDADGNVSKPLAHYLSSAERTQRIYSGLSRAVPHLRDMMLREHIITMTLKAKNMVYKRLGGTEGILVIIDNIGNSDFIPVADYIGLFATRKILKKWRRFESRLSESYPQNDWLRQVLTALPH